MEKRVITYLMLIVALALGMASCSEHDDFVDTNPLHDDIVGTFYKLYDVNGSIDGVISKTSLPHEYTRIVEVYHFGEDGTGLWNRYFFDDESGEPFADLGGGSGGLGRFKYSTQADGSVSVTLDNADAAQDASLYTPLSRMMTFAGGELSGLGIDGQGLKMNRADEGMEHVLMTTWHGLLHGGSGDAEDYNINDKTFTSSNWREQQTIYIYDGSGSEKDAKNRAGYTLINLPWNDGVVSTNLPNGFCDKITPQNGWELVYNLCGNRAINGGNFFFLYNKYSGVMRVFYYMPKEFSSGNDHLWKVTMTGNMAHRSLWDYALPSSSNVKDWTMAGGNGDGTMTDCVTPWVSMKSDDGLIVPNEGWWAYDVDLSLYRQDFSFSDKDNIKLQMWSWDKEHVSLYSHMTASIDGTIKQSTSGSTATSVSKGVLTLGQAGMSVASGVAAFAADNPMLGFAALSNVLGCGTSMAGIFGDGPFEAEVSLGLDGHIDTEGLIQGSATTVGVASPTIYMKNFSNSSTFGHGVWNLKNSPVVYVLNDVYYYMREGGLETVASPCFFDPSSIELMLNPDVFPESEVEWYQVDATCVSNTRICHTGTDSCRTAFGLSPRNMGKSFIKPIRSISQCDLYYGYVYIGGDEEEWDPVSDFLQEKDINHEHQFSEDSNGMIYPAFVYRGKTNGYYTDAIFGRGYKNDYAIDPIYFHYPGWSQSGEPFDLIAPGLEVNVVVQVKMKGMEKPLVYMRNYLPELKSVSMGDFTSRVNNVIQPYQFDSKQEGHHSSYDCHVKYLRGAVDIMWKAFSK